MDNNTPLPAGDVPAPRNDRMRILRAFNVSLAAVLVLVAIGTFVLSKFWAFKARAA